MAKALVKCLYCGETFDRNTIDCVKPKGNRYAHKHCHEAACANKSQEELDYEALVAYIKQLFGGTVNPRVWKQIKEYKDTYEYSYSGMHKTLIWWYELKHNDIEKANGGIGIIPYVYNDALQYYYALYLAQITNEDKVICAAPVREFFIEPPRSIRPVPRLFKFKEENEEEE